jgi:penicillin-binding protein 2
MSFDWQQFHASNTDAPAVVDPRRRLGICLAIFGALLVAVFGRAVQLEVTQGAGFRAVALRPIERKTVLPAARGRILARDGTVLACDRMAQAMAVEYRWIEEPADEAWLMAQARVRLPKAERKNAARLAVARSEVLVERKESAKRLAGLCGLSAEQWTARTRRIQARVERIAENANRHRHSEAERPKTAAPSWAGRIQRFLMEEPPPPRVVVREERQHHVVFEDVPAAVVTEIKGHPDRYPGTQIVELSRRTYPEGMLAAHILGHLGAAEEDLYVGRMGIERQYEAALRGRSGVAVEQVDHGGRVVKSYRREEPVVGGDVELTLDVRLQRTAEELLHSALERRAVGQKVVESSGGAVVVMDLNDGAILAAASAPAFDPNLFAREDGERIAAIMADRGSPLLNRVCQMAIPPGSTFKVLTAAALLESGTVGPDQPFACQGYLHQPDRQRCELFVRQGVGHGKVDLADALAVSCNVYFLHFAEIMGPGSLVDWAERFGFGRPTGVDLPGEAAGTLPVDVERISIRSNDPNGMNSVLRDGMNSVLQVAIGQGTLTATPMQVLCMMAAVANGGRLVMPHVARRVRETHQDEYRSNMVRFTHPTTLAAIREGLRRVVDDPKGTGYGTVRIGSTAIAGKTGTAETGGGLPSHAWFAGYAPADRPKLAFVIVLEHAGDGATAAGPVAKRLVLRMEQLGLL